MEEEEIKKEEEVKNPTNREKFNAMMAERISGFNPEDEEGSYGMLSDYFSKGEEEKQKLVDAINQDPRIASLLADLVSGKRSAANALVRYFGKDFLSAEEGSDTYNEIMEAEEERRAELEKISENERVYKENMDASIPVIEQFCKDKGYEAEDFMDRIWNEIVSPIMQGTYTEELCAKLDKAFNYDKDVEDAMAAGEVKGRNTNIQKMKKEQAGDGMPTGMVSEQPKPKKNRGGNTMLDLALQA